MRRYAEIRQIIERAVENAKASGLANPDSAKLLDKIAEEARVAVPYTVQDVTDIAYGDTNSVRRVAQKIIGDRQEFAKQQTRMNPPPEDAVAQLRAANTPENRKHFDDIFGEGAADKALGLTLPPPPPAQ